MERNSAENGTTAGQERGTCGNQFGNLWRSWSNLTSRFHHTQDRIFYKYGLHVSKRPFLVIAVCVLTAGAFGWGLVLMKPETRADKLYVPQHSKSMEDLSKADKYFPVRVRIAKVILTPKSGGNVFEADIFEAGLKIFQRVINKTALNRVCIKSNPSASRTKPKMTNCATLDPFLYFGYNKINMKNITGIINQIQENPNIAVGTGRPAVSAFPLIFGGLTKGRNGKIQSAKALRFTFFVKYPEDNSQFKTVLEWEKEFIDTVQFMEKEVANQGYNLFYFTLRSIDDSISKSTAGDVKFMIITITIMCTFTCLILGSFRNRVKGHAMVANTGIFAVALGIVTAFGLAIICGTTFISMAGVLPYLVLGVAIDDMFIIVNSLDRCLQSNKNLKTKDIIAETLSGAGGTVTMTTLTDLVAFAVSTTTAFPAIRYFCIYAALSVTFSFVMIMTLFVAFLVYDVKRIQAKRWDMIPCKIEQDETGLVLPKEPELEMSAKVMKAWGEFLMNKCTRKVVILLSLALAVIGILGTLKVDETFTLQMLGTDGSYYIKYIDAESTYYKDDLEISIVVPYSFDLSNATMQKRYLKLTKVATASSKYMAKKSVSWMDSFLIWAATTQSNTTGRYFMKSLHRFLQTLEFSQHKLDIKVDPSGRNIIATRVLVYLDNRLTSTQKKDGMLSLRKALDEQFDFSLYAVNMQFIFFEQYVSTKPETIRNLVICGVTILAMTTPYLIHPGILIFVSCSFAALIVELLGLMAVWCVSLNSISMIVLVMAIGFSVDYSAHVAHAYITSKAHSPEDRIIDSLTNVGASVLMGGFTTFLGMVTTVFASSEIFRIFFKMFLGIVVLGLVHGLCFLPVYMVEFCRSRVIQEQVVDPPQSVSHPQECGAVSSPPISNQQHCKVVTGKAKLRSGSPEFSARQSCTFYGEDKPQRRGDNSVKL